MFPLDLAELERVNRETGVSVFREPGAVMLVGRFVAVTDAIDLHAAVTADIEYRREGAILFRGAVKVGRDVKFGAGLEGKVFDDDSFALDRTRDLRLEIGSGRERLQAEHFKELPSQIRLGGGPVARVFDERCVARGEATGLAFEILIEHPITLGRFRRDGAIVGGECRHDGEEQKGEAEGTSDHGRRIRESLARAQAENRRDAGGGGSFPHSRRKGRANRPGEPIELTIGEDRTGSAGTPRPNCLFKDGMMTKSLKQAFD